MEATLRRMRDEGVVADYQLVERVAEGGEPEQEIRLVFAASSSDEARQRTIEGVILAAVAAGARVTISTATAPRPEAPGGGDDEPAPAPWWRRIFRRGQDGG
jgi:hypothetical protein